MYYGAVDTGDNFVVGYEIIGRNEKHVDTFIKALKKAEALYLATDPDREGEAISWYLYELLRKQGLLERKEVQRVLLYEITKAVIKSAIEANSSCFVSVWKASFYFVERR